MVKLSFPSATARVKSSAVNGVNDLRRPQSFGSICSEKKPKIRRSAEFGVTFWRDRRSVLVFRQRTTAEVTGKSLTVVGIGDI